MRFGMGELNYGVPRRVGAGRGLVAVMDIATWRIWEYLSRGRVNTTVDRVKTSMGR